MQIKQQALNAHLNKKIAPVYWLIGSDHYLLQTAFESIKKTIKQQFDCEVKRLTIEAPDDWNSLIEESNSYSLFSETTLLTVRYEKKNIDAKSKKNIETLLATLNSRCYLVISAPNLPIQQTSWLSSYEQVVVVVAQPLNEAALKQWIDTQLKNHSLQYPPPIVGLIYQYTQGNMAACAQAIEKIALTNAAGSQINEQQVLEHLFNQCEHSLYELIEACLKGQADKAIQILRQAANNKTEATLVLWMLTQEARVLSQLGDLIEQKMDANAACKQLKLWPSRLSLYQSRLRQSEDRVFERLLGYARRIDERIKSNLSEQAWHSLECFCLSFCAGRLIGDACND